ncbi:MAG: amino acid deaminase/aldolase [Lapillicoccus sp.]
MPALTAADLERFERASVGLTPPFAVVDLVALRANADDLVRRAGGLPIRVASKSVRVRAVIDEQLRRPGFRGIMAFSLREALWLAREGHENILLGYPSVDTTSVAELSTDPRLARTITLMVDGAEHLDLLRAAAAGPEPVRVCLDVDASLRLGPVHLGVRRSPLRSPVEAAALAEQAVEAGFGVVGLMFYDAQIAGLPDTSYAVRLVKQLSDRDLRRRRSAVVDAVRAVDGVDLEIVNGGGTGSLHVTGRDPSLTELAAGSGLYGPTLFDGYRDFHPTPAAIFALPVVRRPAPGIVTAFSGGYVASGPPGWSRVPQPVAVQGLRLKRDEGTGEVQTPLLGRAADGLRLGDRVWLRHAKAGELMERFTQVHLVEGDRLVGTVPTYRGEGWSFG